MRRDKNLNQNKETRPAIFILVLFLLSIFFIGVPDKEVAAQATTSELQDEAEQLNKEITDLNNKIAQKKQERATLEGEIAVFNDEIYKITLQIQATQAQLNKTQAEIDSTIAKIKQAEEDLFKQKETLRENIRTFYEEGQVSSVEVIASSDNFSEYMDRSEYLRSLQDKIVETVSKIKALKEELNKKKKELETKKTEITNLRNQQQSQKSDLANQKTAKDNLLIITKGQEKEFQSVLKDANAKMAQVQEEIWRNANPGTYVSLGKIKKGESLGVMGNTGYSTGAHLHFEFRNTSNVGIDPEGILGNGTYDLPVKNYIITQGCYGTFSHKGAGGPCGIDFVSQENPPMVRSVADGEIIKRVSGWGNTYYTNPQQFVYGNYVIVAHYDGTFALYAHLQ